MTKIFDTWLDLTIPIFRYLSDKLEWWAIPIIVVIGVPWGFVSLLLLLGVGVEKYLTGKWGT